MATVGGREYTAEGMPNIFALFSVWFGQGSHCEAGHTHTHTHTHQHVHSKRQPGKRNGQHPADHQCGDNHNHEDDHVVVGVANVGHRVDAVSDPMGPVGRPEGQGSPGVPSVHDETAAAVVRRIRIRTWIVERGKIPRVF